MRQVLVIDDLRKFRTVLTDTQVTYARTSQEGVNILHEDITWDEIWLDHDLGQDEFGINDTIMPVVDELAERAFNKNPVRAGRVFVHTSNPSGARQMLTTLRRWEYPAEQVQPERFFVV